jgi:hypothetical protein
MPTMELFESLSWHDGSDCQDAALTRSLESSEESSLPLDESSSSIPPHTILLLAHSAVDGGDDDVPLSLRFPWNDDDLASPEGRFARRRQQLFAQQEQNSILLGLQNDDSNSSFELQDVLPAYYFTNPDLDDTAKLLESLPWHYVLHADSIINDSNSINDWALWDQHMTDQLSHLDHCLLTVQKQLLRVVQPHQDSIRNLNSLQHHWERHATLASMYWQRSVDALQWAAGEAEQGTGIIGHSLLLQYWTQRDRLAVVNKVLEDVANVESRARDLFDWIDSFDLHIKLEYVKATKMAEELRQTLCEGSLARIECLEDQRVLFAQIGGRFWKRLLLLCESTAVRRCRKIDADWSSYAQVLQICLDLRIKYPDSLPSDSDFSSCWVDRLVTAFCYEADRSFASL